MYTASVRAGALIEIKYAFKRLYGVHCVFSLIDHTQTSGHQAEEPLPCHYSEVVGSLFNFDSAYKDTSPTWDLIPIYRDLIHLSYTAGNTNATNTEFNSTAGTGYEPYALGWPLSNCS